MNILKVPDGKDTFYIIVDKNGNFFAKLYSQTDAELIINALEAYAEKG